MTIHWYPGHMAKTKRLIEEHLKQVDAICVVLDARIPLASQNPTLNALVDRKPLLYVLGREDQADPAQTRLWLSHFRGQNAAAIAVNAKTGNGIERLSPAIQELLKEKIAARNAKGQIGRALRLMVVGIPNVGKSSLINRVSGRKPAKAEDRPGVTRGKQWVEVDRGLLLLDMPGVLWPKLDDAQVALHLAFTGAIKDTIMDIETLAMHLCDTLKTVAPAALMARCKWSELPEETGYDLLALAAKARGCLLRGNQPDTERVAKLLVDEFRSGKLGRITLEAAPQTI